MTLNVYMHISCSAANPPLNENVCTLTTGYIMDASSKARVNSTINSLSENRDNSTTDSSSKTRDNYVADSSSETGNNSITDSSSKNSDNSPVQKVPKKALKLSLSRSTKQHSYQACNPPVDTIIYTLMKMNRFHKPIRATATYRHMHLRTPTNACRLKVARFSKISPTQ